MKILEPVESPSGNGNSKYSEIYEAAEKIVNGKALPVQFETRDEALRLSMAIRNNRGKTFRVSVRGNTVFIFKRDV